MLYVTDDADDLRGAIKSCESDPLSDRVLIREYAVGKFLVDDQNLQVTRVILSGECPSAQHRNLHRAEVVRADGVKQRDTSLGSVARPWLVLTPEAKRGATCERECP